MAKKIKKKELHPELSLRSGILLRTTRSGRNYGCYFNNSQVYYCTEVFRDLDQSLTQILMCKDYWNNDMSKCINMTLEEKLDFVKQYLMEHDDGALEVIQQEFKYL